MEFSLILEQKHHKKLLFNLIDFNYLNELNLILWGEEHKNYYISKSNYIDIISFLNSSKSYYWWLENDEFSAEYSDEFEYLILEFNNYDSFIKNYLYLRDKYSVRLILDIDEVLDISTLRVFIKEYFIDYQIVYEDSYIIDFGFIKFSFLHGDFSLELRKNIYMDKVKKVLNLLYERNVISDNIKLLNSL